MTKKARMARPVTSAVAVASVGQRAVEADFMAPSGSTWFMGKVVNDGSLTGRVGMDSLE